MPKVTIIRWNDTDFVPQLLDASNDTATINNIDISGSSGDLKIGSIDATSIIIGKNGSLFFVSGSAIFNADLTASAGLKVTASVDLPGQQAFKLDGISVSSNNFTATNLSRLFDGSNVDDLHSHAFGSSSVLLTNPDIVHTFMVVESGLTGSQVVYISGSNSVKLASANNITTSRIVGVVSGSSAITYNSGSIVKVYTIYGDIFGGFSALNAGSTYYLSSTPGAISSTPPSGGGKTIFQIGIAKSSTELVFQPLIVAKI